MGMHKAATVNYSSDRYDATVKVAVAQRTGQVRIWERRRHILTAKTAFPEGMQEILLMCNSVVTVHLAPIRAWWERQRVPAARTWRRVPTARMCAATSVPRVRTRAVTVWIASSA